MRPTPASRRTVTIIDTDYTIEALKEASGNQFAAGKEYIAVAVARSAIQNDHVDVTLGDESETSCDIKKLGVPEERLLSGGFGGANTYKGRNLEMRDGLGYSIFLVASTPALNSVELRRSTSTSIGGESGDVDDPYPGDEDNVKEGCSGIGLVFAVILLPAVLMVAGGFLVVRKNRQKQVKKDEPSQEKEGEYGAPEKDYVSPKEDEDEEDRYGTYGEIYKKYKKEQRTKEIGKRQGKSHRRRSRRKR